MAGCFLDSNWEHAIRHKEDTKVMKKLIDILPLLTFIILIGVLFSFLSNKNNQLETVLIDDTFPQFSLSSLKDSSETLTQYDIKKLPALINIWATWCIACRIEHPFLMKLKEESVLPIYGLNYKDNREKALELLERDGDPFEFSIYDFEGRLAIDLGVYGAPETFFIDSNGVIRERHVGVVDEDVWKKKFAKYLDE